MVTVGTTALYFQNQYNIVYQSYFNKKIIMRVVATGPWLVSLSWSYGTFCGCMMGL